MTFTPKAIDLVHGMSGGVPRVINLICDRALMAGCRAQTGKIGNEHVAEAARQLGLELPPATRRFARGGWRPWRAVAAGLVMALLALVGAGTASWGAPAGWLDPGLVPPAGPAPALRLYPALAALPVPDLPAGTAPPPLGTGAFSVHAGTFDSPRVLAAVEPMLRAQHLPVYTIDIVFGPGDIRRRLLIGRYQTREDADAVLAKFAALLPGATVIPGEHERLRVVPAQP